MNCTYRVILHGVTIKHSTRVILAYLLTNKACERMKKAPKEQMEEVQAIPLEDAYYLHFDGAFKRSLEKSVVGIVITPTL